MSSTKLKLPSSKKTFALFSAQSRVKSPQDPDLETIFHVIKASSERSFQFPYRANKHLFKTNCNKAWNWDLSVNKRNNRRKTCLLQHSSNIINVINCEERKAIYFKLNTVKGGEESWHCVPAIEKSEPRRRGIKRSPRLVLSIDEERIFNSID